MTGSSGVPRLAQRRLDVAAARLEDLAALRELVARACDESGAPGDVRDALVLATDELCSNIVLHGYAGGAPGPISIDVAIGGGEGRAAVVTITDAALPFDPGAVAPPDLDAPLEARAVGGLGLHLVRALVDELRYERRPEGNRHVLVKRMPG